MILDDFTAATRELLAVLGEQGTVVRGAADPVPLTFFVDDALQELGNYARVMSGKRAIGMMKADWQPARGDVITVRNETRKVDEIATDDGIIVVVVMHG